MVIKIGKCKFEIIPTLFTIPTFMFLLYLGFWQLERLEFKKTEILKIQNRINQPPEEIIDEIENLEDFKYRKVKVTGEYIHDKQMFLYSGSRSGKKLDGYMVITPLKMRNGKIILVNRGWIPTKYKAELEKINNNESREVDVIGYVMTPETKSWFMPNNDTKKNIWIYYNFVEMENFVGKKLEKFYLKRAYDGEDLPIASDLDTNNIRNNHLEYAITWFFAAFTLISIFFIYHKNNRN